MKQLRKDRGYALVSIMVIGIFAITALLTLAASLTSVTRSQAYAKREEELRVAAEAGIDYAINQFNSTYPCRLDPPDGEESTPPIPIPVGYLATTVTVTNEFGSQQVSNHVDNLSVSVVVRRILNVSDWDYLASNSSIYSPQLDPRLSTSTSYANPPKTNVTADDWRIVESTASYPGMRKTIRAILQPQYDPAPNGVPPAPPGEQQPFFPYGMFGNSKIALSGGLTVQSAGPELDSSGSPYSSYLLTLATNKLATVGSGTELRGNLQVSSKLSGNTAVATNDGTIHGRVDLNGQPDASVRANPGETPSDTPPPDNVRADADLANGDTQRRGPNNTTPLLDSTSTPPPPQLSQALMSPTPQGNGQAIAVLPALSQIDPDSPVIRAATDHLGRIIPYQTIGLSTNDVATPIQVDTSNGPVRLVVKDGSNGEAVNIHTNKLITPTADARSFQIWYSGNKEINIKLNGNDFSGLIYAPNAKVKTTGDGTFEGAIIADHIDIRHAGYMKLYTDLANTSPDGPNALAGILYGAAEGSTKPLVQGYRAITWEELK